MAGQHVENLFRRFKGEIVTIKTTSGATFEGRIAEVTNDYACLHEANSTEGAELFLFFDAIESMAKGKLSSN